jgi:D-cysteine desulfhydrase family pyridoxal phosphate-dependent enzyme
MKKAPRISLANLPTPLEEMKNFSKVMGGPKVFIKRDDETGIAFGGSKARVLEFCMADAIAKKADVVIASGGRAGIQSNWVRMVASAARHMGMKAALILRGEEPHNYNGNLLLDYLLGADIRFMKIRPEETHQTMEEVKKQLIAMGQHPYIVNDESIPGIVGYALLMAELLNQAKQKGINTDYVVTACGSGGTLAGLLFGSKATNSGIKLLGISVQERSNILADNISRMANEISSFLNVSLTFNKSDVTIFDRFVKKGYGVLSKDVLEAIELVAQTEGIILDPVYTGKAMAGLLELIREGYFDRNGTVVFIHTGGTPALFSYCKGITSYVKK